MYPTFSLRQYLNELARPWKLVTLTIAVGYYVWGAYYYRCPTWDVPVSLLMATLTYLFAPGTIKSALHLIQERPRHWIGGLFVCGLIIYFCASGSYELYNWWHLGIHPPPTYWVNLYYSTLMFIAAGLLWKFEGSFKEMFLAVRRDLEKLSKGKK